MTCFNCSSLPLTIIVRSDEVNVILRVYAPEMSFLRFHTAEQYLYLFVSIPPDFLLIATFALLIIAYDPLQSQLPVLLRRTLQVDFSLVFPITVHSFSRWR